MKLALHLQKELIELGLQAVNVTQACRCHGLFTLKSS